VLAVAIDLSTTARQRHTTPETLWDELYTLANSGLLVDVEYKTRRGAPTSFVADIQKMTLGLDDDGATVAEIQLHEVA
jgi:hypothetical protein